MRTGGRALATRSATLVARGLKELTRESNWTRVEAFRGKASKVAVSSAGSVCAISAEARNSPPRVTVYELKNPYGELALAVPGETPALAKHLPAAFVWSRSGRYLAGAWAAWEPAIHLFDLVGKEFVGAFGKFQTLPSCIAWSPDSRFVAAATGGGKAASLRVWGVGEMLQDAPIAQVGVPDWQERQTYEAEFGEEGAFQGYGRTAFGPDGQVIASVVEIQGEWADDSIFLATLPEMKNVKSFQAQGHVTDLTWLPGGGAIIYCAAAQAYRLELATMQAEPCTFGAEICVAHPTLPVVACFTSWRQQESAKGRLFVVDLRTGGSFDECEAEGIAEIRWSEDGARAYAVTKNGTAYIYEPEVL